jgi:hypothetical protein
MIAAATAPAKAKSRFLVTGEPFLHSPSAKSANFFGSAKMEKAQGYDTRVERV